MRLSLATLPLFIAALALTACAKPPSPVCLGLVKMTPKVETSRYIVQHDVAFALQVAGDNRTIAAECR